MKLFLSQLNIIVILTNQTKARTKTNTGHRMGVSGGERNPKWLREVNKLDTVFCCLSSVVNTNHTHALGKCRLHTYMRTIYKPAYFRGVCTKAIYKLASLGKRVNSLSSRHQQHLLVFYRHEDWHIYLSLVEVFSRP